MKDKIIARLADKFPGVNLSKTRKDAIADKLAPKITDETEIDAKLDELNEIFSFADMAKQDDKIRTIEAKEKKKPEQQEQKKPEEEKPTEDEAPAWAKSLIQEVQQLKAEKQQQSIREQAKAKLKDVPEIIWKRAALPEKAEELDAWADEIISDYEADRKAEKDKNIIDAGKPLGSNTPGGKQKEASEKEVKQVLDRL